jgi:NitT/TauT family transport system substrate-binding protein
MSMNVWAIWKGSAAAPVLTRVCVLAMVGVLAVVGGCKKDGPGTTVGSAEAPPPDEVKLAYFANVTHAQAVLGVHSGDFEKALAPSKLTTKVFNAGPELIEAMNAGNVDIGYVGPGPALNGFIKSGGKMVRVIAGVAGNGVVIVARPGSGIEKLSDLVGKKLATPQLANTQDIAAKFYLLSQLKQANADSVQPTKNAEQAAQMSAGRLDAAWAPEPWGAFLEAKAGAKVIAEEKDIKELWPEGNMGITYVIARPEFLQKHPDVVEKVLGVHVKWTDRMKSEPDKWQPDLEAALGKLTNAALPPGVLKKAIGRTLFTDDPMAHTFARQAQWMYAAGFAKDVADTAAIVDTTILKKVRAATPAAAATATAPAGK